jgi:Fe-S oxidoreductase
VTEPAENIKKALAAFDSGLDRKLAASLEACLHCGRCADACIFYLGSGDKSFIPGKRLQVLAKLYRARKTPLGKLLSLLGAGRFGKPDLEKLRGAFESCTMCGRCETFCVAGINTGELVFLARTMLGSAEGVPQGLKRTLDLELSSGNSMGLTVEDFKETVDWLSEELIDEYGAEIGTMPVDFEGARSFYLINPREVKFYPLSLQAAAKVFNAAGESWTFSTKCLDVTNYGYYAGDTAAAAEIAGRALDAAGKLGCRRIVASECGHGYSTLRWGASHWLKQRPDIEIVSILEIMDEYLADGRIRTDRSRNADRVTLHDPCNLVRRGGVVEPQRRILNAAVSDWVEMSPNRRYNYCCGGGGGMRVQTRLKQQRLDAAKVKAEQIRRTGAKIVVAPCHNCIDQLEDISKEYELGVKVTTLVELVAEALVIEGKGE